MKKFILLASTLLVTLTISTVLSAAAYLKIGDIKGEAMARDENHKNWIVIESYAYSNGTLVIKHKNGRSETLRNGKYKFKDGNQFSVKNGRAQKILGRGNTNLLKARAKTKKKPGVETEDIGRKSKKSKKSKNGQ
jgi:hypothetical protein